MNEEFEKVKIRIAKLLNLAKGKANINESAVAASMAAKLMAEYNISNEEIIKVELKKSANILEDDIMDVEYKKWPVWMQSISINIAKLYDCQVTFRAGVEEGSRFIVVRGYEADVLMVKWTFEFLHKEIIRQTERYVKNDTSKNNKRTVRNSYQIGAVMTVKEMVDEMIKEKQINTSGTSLMVLKSQLIEEKFGETKYGNAPKFKADADAYYSGRENAKNINLNRPLGDKRETPKHLN
jgi:hypothetical protein